MSGALQPTPHADVNAVLRDFLARIRSILGDHFIALYVYGSLALGDFDPRSSDIDFVVVTDAALPHDLFAALYNMHARFDASDSPWATEVEAIYIPRDALRRYDPDQARHPHIQRGETLVMHQVDSGWVPLLYIIREHGIVLAGPDPRTLIDPIDPGEIRHAVAPLAEAWFGPALLDPELLRRRGAHAFLVLTLCRILYTLDSGAVVSKPIAARWARQLCAGRWVSLIERATAWRKHPDCQEPLSNVEVRDTQTFIAYTLERGRQLKHSVSATELQ